MAQQLQALGQEVNLLALFDCSAYRWYLRDLTPMALAAHKMSSGIRRASYHLSNLLFRPAKSAYLWSKSRTLQRRIRSKLWRASYWTQRALDRSLPRTLQNVKESNWLAARLYVPQPYCGRITLFRALERGAAVYQDPQLGWGVFALGGVEIHPVPGDHVSLLEEPQVRVLAERLRACLDRV
jgi:aspartate racemase